MEPWFGIVFVLAVVLSLGLLRLSQGRWRVDNAVVPVRVGGEYSPVLTWLRGRALQIRVRPPVTRALVWAWLAPALEIGAIIGFAAWLGRDFLLSPPTNWPLGSDFLLNVQGYYAWPALRQCGLCVLWNGTVNGGAPLFAELLAAVAHPLVVFFILSWGVISGLKVTVVAGLALAGLAQWWLARSLHLGLVARLWSAAMAMVGGHLAARLEEGLIEEVFAAASCGLVLAAALDLIDTGSRRAVVVFGVMLALALLAGQGYMQLGLLLGTLPALLILLIGSDLRLRPVWRPLAVGFGLALLLTAFYWIPFVHFLPHFAKFTDAEFSTAEPLAYLPLNLVIRDYTFYTSNALGLNQQAHLYANYIGWVPILLILTALRLVPRAGRRKLAFFLAAVCLVALAASSLTFRLIARLPVPVLANFVTGVRYPSEISSLMITPLLAVAAWGLDLLLKFEWPRLNLSLASGPALSLSVAWVLVGVPLVGAVYSAYDFGHVWLQTYALPDDYFRVVPQVRPATTAWVDPPVGDSAFIVLALSEGFKLTNDYRPWSWRDRNPPPAALRVTRDAVDPATPGYEGQVEYLSLVSQPENAYASVTTAAGTVPCAATALNGNIDVTCHTEQPGQLRVLENAWSGWGVTRDGARAALVPGDYLLTDAPAGTHVYHFRYRPWDVVLGALLTLAGLVFAIRLWRRPPALVAGGSPTALVPFEGPGG